MVWRLRRVKVDTVFRCGQLATPKGKEPLCGEAMAAIDVIDDAGIAIRDGIVMGVGRFGRVTSRFHGRTRNLGDRLVTPGLVDSHSHILFAGSRENELGMKLSGSSYMEILAAGGGILKTVRRTREASKQQLARESRARLLSMLAGGVTAAEVKSGYGLNLKDELKMLSVAAGLGGRMLTVPTYLGAHAFPEELKRADYVRKIISSHLPEVKRRSLSSYCDIFIEKGAFSLAESRRILKAARKLGFKLTAHVDEFSHTGGAILAAELGAESVSHLAFTTKSEFGSLASAGVTGIILPSTPLFSMSSRYPDARTMIDEGMSVAIGTDLSPNSWNQSLLFSCMLAVYNCRLRQEEVITAATLNSACAIGLGGNAGSLERGKRADFVCFDLDNYRKMFYTYTPDKVNSVFVLGREAARNQRVASLSAS